MLFQVKVCVEALSVLPGMGLAIDAIAGADAPQFPPTVPDPLMRKVSVAAHPAVTVNAVGVVLPSVTGAIGVPTVVDVLPV